MCPIAAQQDQADVRAKAGNDRFWRGAVTTEEVKDLRREARELKDVVAVQPFPSHPVWVLNSHMIAKWREFM